MDGREVCLEFPLNDTPYIYQLQDKVAKINMFNAHILSMARVNYKMHSTTKLHMTLQESTTRRFRLLKKTSFIGGRE